MADCLLLFYIPVIYKNRPLMRYGIIYLENLKRKKYTLEPFRSI